MASPDSTPVYGSVNIDEIVEFGTSVPVGRYTVRMLQCDGKLSQSSNPMLFVNWEILDHPDHDGKEVSTLYMLMVTVKNGKQYASGLVNLKKIYASVGKPLPKGYNFVIGDPGVPGSVQKSLDQNRKMFMEKVGQQRMELLVTRDPKPMVDRDTKEVMMDDEGNPRHGTIRTIIGPANRTGGSGFATEAVAAVPAGVTSKPSSSTTADEVAAMLANG